MLPEGTIRTGLLTHSAATAGGVAAPTRMRAEAAREEEQHARRALREAAPRKGVTLTAGEQHRAVCTVRCRQGWCAALTAGMGECDAHGRCAAAAHFGSASALPVLVTSSNFLSTSIVVCL